MAGSSPAMTTLERVDASSLEPRWGLQNCTFMPRFAPGGSTQRWTGHNISGTSDTRVRVPACLQDLRLTPYGMSDHDSFALPLWPRAGGDCR
jgi:hypothetical protein